MEQQVRRPTDWTGRLLFAVTGFALGALLLPSRQLGGVPEAALAPSPTLVAAQPEPEPEPKNADFDAAMPASGEGVPEEMRPDVAPSRDLLRLVQDQADWWDDEPSAPLTLDLFSDWERNWGRRAPDDLQSLGPVSAVRLHLAKLQQWTLTQQRSPATVLVKSEVVSAFDVDFKSIDCPGWSEWNRDWSTIGEAGMWVYALLYWAEITDATDQPLDAKTVTGQPSGNESGWAKVAGGERTAGRRWIDQVLYSVKPDTIIREPETLPEFRWTGPNMGESACMQVPVRVTNRGWSVELDGRSRAAADELPFETHLPVVDMPSVLVDAIVARQGKATSER